MFVGFDTLALVLLNVYTEIISYKYNSMGDFEDVSDH
jgi:hypothetical protein